MPVFYVGFYGLSPSLAFLFRKPQHRGMNRPPPYFPQNQLSPPNPNRYRNFKIMVGVAILALLLLLAGAGVGIYYLVRYLFS
jgi:hypothetical protein